MTEDQARREVVAWWMRKSAESLASADSELTAGRYAFVANRSYYAVFYALSAVLLAEGARYSKHSGLRAAMHRDLIKTGRLSEQWGRAFDRLYESRQRADYMELSVVDSDHAASLLESAHGFVAEMRVLLVSS